jgi:hypothetical protein
MQHLDEGTIHAWLDGALAADGQAAVEAHVAACDQCAAMVAEARGLVAASSRIVSALDVTPAGVIPAFGTRKRRIGSRWIGSAIAATLVIAAGTMLTMQRRPTPPDPSTTRASSVSAEVPRSPGVVVTQPPVDQPSSAVPKSVNERRVAAGMRDEAKSPVGEARRNSIVDATATPSSPMVAAVRAPIASPTPAVIPDRRDASAAGGVVSGMGAGMAKAAAAPVAVSGRFGATRQARPSMAAEPQIAMSRDLASVSALVGCYEVDESTDVLPRRFALAMAVDPGMPGEVRYVDSTGARDGRIPDVSWVESNGQAIIRTVARGEVLVIRRGDDTLFAQSTLGLRTIRARICR